MNKRILCTIILILCVFSVPTNCFSKETSVIGMYGVPAGGHDKNSALATKLKENNVSAVFVPPDKNTIKFFKEQGFEVFLTLNVFGGKQPWKEFPASIPVIADGSKLSGKYGGICPTHYEWRESRLQLLDKWLTEFSGEDSVSGIWLDFIRYPGSWEHADSVIPDTCYCDRCLLLFQIEKGVEIPKGLSSQNTSEWIKKHAASKWLEWKKEQITSFVRDAKTVIDANESGTSIKFGAFLVPWMQGEKNSSMTFLLAQDAEQIGRYVDILSPMVYHEMLGKTPNWIRETTEYFSDITDKPVWPIIQAQDLQAEEFKEAVDAVTFGEGDGVLVYSYSRMEDNYWPLLSSFVKQTDLLNQEGQSPNKCTIGKQYLFEADFFRQTRLRTSYPEVILWGKTFLLNTHRIIGKYQHLRVHFTCTEEMAESGAEPFKMKKPRQGQQFYPRNPHLYQKQEYKQKTRADLHYDYFPVGAYGGNLNNLQEFKDSGLNSSILGLSKEAVEQCVKLDMHCTFSLPRDVEKIKILLDKVGQIPKTGRFAFYVNDEPGIHSFPRWKAKDIDLLLKERYPEMPTMMAVVRPQVIPDYTQAADYFMLDQYPVPFMPMTWLSTSMDIAAETVGKKRLFSIIQAFGGEKWKVFGWPRLPTYEEMNCLAFLSIIHGSRGIYFYKYQAITATKESKQAFENVIANIQQIQPWLIADTIFTKVPVKMTSGNRFDPAGNPAIQCGEKQIDGKRLLICVNTIETYVSAEIPAIDTEELVISEYNFTPFEVKLFP